MRNALKKSVSILSLIAACIIPSVASADPINVGGSIDLSVPDGLGVGVAVQPWTQYFRVGASLQDNYISPGLRASVAFTPIKFPIFPELEIACGWFSRQNIPFSINGVSNLNLQYNYADFLFGIGFGNRDRAMLLLSGGVSFIDANMGNIGPSIHISNAYFDNPTFKGWVPSAKLGTVFFF